MIAAIERCHAKIGLRGGTVNAMLRIGAGTYASIHWDAAMGPSGRKYSVAHQFKWPAHVVAARPPGTQSTDKETPSLGTGRVRGKLKCKLNTKKQKPTNR